MRLIFYIFFISQLLSFIGVFAEKNNDDLLELDPVKWKKIEKIKSNPLKKIIWKSYKNDEFYFENNNGSITNKNNSSSEKKIYDSSKKSVFSITEIEPFLPLNNFLDYGNLKTSVRFKSSFDGGISSGSGQQNPSFIFDYGISETSLISIYLSESDDDLYNLVGGQLVNYHWQNIAFSYKKELLTSNDNSFGISIVPTIEYWRHSSGSEFAKSIYNQKDNSNGKERFNNLIGSLSIPLSKKILNDNFTFLIVPGITFLPEKLGIKGTEKNAYGNNFYIGSGLVFDVTDKINILLSYTTPLGPGNNYFNSNLIYSRKSIYAVGLGWDVNSQVGFEGKITNSYGATPSTGLLTIPSDDLPLYSAQITYKPYKEDTYLAPLNKRDNLISHGGITVSNALIPRSGTSQINLNYDSKGNLFGFYGYSLSNIFQLELINIGNFNDFNYDKNSNFYSGYSRLYSTYFGENNLNFRLGGKFLILSPQKNDLFWASLRASVGRNNTTNQGYLFSEFINTFRVNNWLTLNISPKYFFSGVERFGALGFSSYINLTDNLQLIPEINYSFNKYHSRANDTEFNSTLALRYSFSPEMSLDLYYSNAAGVQDIGQILQDRDYRVGVRANFLY